MFSWLLKGGPEDYRIPLGHPTGQFQIMHQHAHPEQASSFLFIVTVCTRGYKDGIVVDRVFSGPILLIRDLPPFTKKKSPFPQMPLSWSSFDLVRVIGMGGYGTVSLVRHRASGLPFAIKEVNKAIVLQNGRLPHLLSERQLLDAINSPFIAKLRGTFQDHRSVYFVLDYIPGGELFRLLSERDILTEAETRFYAAELLQALEHLHAMHVAYRDLKPENVLLDAEGHVLLTDLGLAKVIPPDGRSVTVCGTPEYSAPEVVINDGHGRAVDLWALGCLVYECVVGRTPFHDDDAAIVYHKILEGRVQYPGGLSPQLRDLLGKLLEPDANARLVDFGLIRGHPWFRGVDWHAIATRTVRNFEAKRLRLRSSMYRERFFVFSLHQRYVVLIVRPEPSPPPLPPAQARPPFRPPIRGPWDTSRFDEYTEQLIDRQRIWASTPPLTMQMQALFLNF